MKSTLLIVLVIGIVGIIGVGLLITIDYLQKSEYPPPIDFSYHNKLNHAKEILEKLDLPSFGIGTNHTNHSLELGFALSEKENADELRKQIDAAIDVPFTIDFVEWESDSNFCKESKGVWNSTVRGCYGLYEMCEKNGGIPRFLKKSLPFPDIEENKPIEYLMDCNYDLTIEENYWDTAG